MKKKQVLVLLSAGMLLLVACGNPGTKEAADNKTAETAEEEVAEGSGWTLMYECRSGVRC